MLIQRAGTGTLPPPGFTSPPWSALAAAWDAYVAAHPPSTHTVTLGPATLTLGHDDCEGDDLKPEVAQRVDGHVFGWDNESPKREVQVGKIKVEWRPVTNEEYLTFWEGGAKEGLVEVPPSWVVSDEGIQVCFFTTLLCCGRDSFHVNAGPHAVRTRANECCEALAGVDVVRRSGSVR